MHAHARTRTHTTAPDRPSRARGWSDVHAIVHSPSECLLSLRCPHVRTCACLRWLVSIDEEEGEVGGEKEEAVGESSFERVLASKAVAAAEAIGVECAVFVDPRTGLHMGVLPPYKEEAVAAGAQEPAPMSP